MKNCGLIVAVVVVLIFLWQAVWLALSVCHAVTREPRLPTVSPAATPSGPRPPVARTILADRVRDGGALRFVQVVLDRRVTEEELRDLAWAIKLESPRHRTIQIAYWIEGMDTLAAAWATTRFRTGRDLYLRIHGLTPGLLTRALAEPPPGAAEIVGRWLTDQLPRFAGLVTIYVDEHGTPFFFRVVPTGSTQTNELVESSVPDARRFKFIGIHPDFHLIVEAGPEGRLLFYRGLDVWGIGRPTTPTPGTGAPAGISGAG